MRKQQKHKQARVCVWKVAPLRSHFLCFVQYLLRNNSQLHAETECNPVSKLPFHLYLRNSVKQPRIGNYCIVASKLDRVSHSLRVHCWLRRSNSGWAVYCIGPENELVASERRTGCDRGSHYCLLKRRMVEKISNRRQAAERIYWTCDVSSSLRIAMSNNRHSWLLQNLVTTTTDIEFVVIQLQHSFHPDQNVVYIIRSAHFIFLMSHVKWIPKCYLFLSKSCKLVRKESSKTRKHTLVLTSTRSQCMIHSTRAFQKTKSWPKRNKKVGRVSNEFSAGTILCEPLMWTEIDVAC